jgi:Uma2 family endonuclease
MNHPILIYDRDLADTLLKQRQMAGGDRFDEVWNGVYVMSPIANNEHQNLVSEIVAVCRTLVDWQGLGKTFAGANVTDRSDGWQENYRVPDVLVFSRDTSAIDLQTHWLGGPDLAIEIVSDGDRTYEKLDFYASVGTRELVIIDRQPWKLSLYSLSDNRLSLELISTLDHPIPIPSKLFPICFQLQADPRQLILGSYSQAVRSIAI